MDEVVELPRALLLRPGGRGAVMDACPSGRRHYGGRDTDGCDVPLSAAAKCSFSPPAPSWP